MTFIQQSESEAAQVAAEWRTFTIINAVVAFCLLLAMADLPYGYYVLLRWVVCLHTVFIAVRRFSAGSAAYGCILLVVAIVFNPIFPLHLGKSVWLVVDPLAAAIILASEFIPPPGMSLRQYLELGEKGRAGRQVSRPSGKT